jgi:hypothetical protein
MSDQDTGAQPNLPPKPPLSEQPAEHAAQAQEAAPQQVPPASLPPTPPLASPAPPQQFQAPQFQAPQFQSPQPQPQQFSTVQDQPQFGVPAQQVPPAPYPSPAGYGPGWQQAPLQGGGSGITQQGAFRQFAPRLSLILSGVTLVGLVFVRIFAAVLSSSGKDLIDYTSQDRIADVLGGFGLASIVLIVAAIVFGHMGLTDRTGENRLRALAAFALGVGYVLAVLYLLRFIIAVITVLPAFSAAGGNVAGNFFWWA